MLTLDSKIPVAPIEDAWTYHKNNNLTEKQHYRQALKNLVTIRQKAYSKRDKFLKQLLEEKVQQDDKMKEKAIKALQTLNASTNAIQE